MMSIQSLGLANVEYPKTKLLSPQTSLLCIVGELALGGSVAVTVSVGDR